jgi:TetR/AcrR family transcriptional regulator, transcriptional repressor of bet genes
MPKIVNHEQRRQEIAKVACTVVASVGFEQATIVKIAAAAGFTTGMIAHYFATKKEIIQAALHLSLKRVEQRLQVEGESLEMVLANMLPLDQERAEEASFWVAYWGQVLADKELKTLNSWVHREYARLYERVFARYWPEWHEFTPATRRAVSGAVSTFIDGATTQAALFPAENPPELLLSQLSRQIQLWYQYAKSEQRKSKSPSAVRAFKSHPKTLS